MLNKFTQALFALFVSACSVFAQVYPKQDDNIRETIRQAEQWIDIGSYHTARVDLERLLHKPSSAGERSRILFLLMNAAFSDQDFERSFQYSQEFLTGNQADERRNSAIYCSGVSAYHTGRYEIALQSLNTYLQNVPQSSARGIALYWRGLCRLQQNQFPEAESDFEECLRDSSSYEFHDEVLMGLSLLAERQGDAMREAKYLDQLIALYPTSNLANDARIRLAGLSIRRGDFMQGLTLLENVKPKYQSQHEQLLLLRADAEYRSGSYERAAADYAAYLKQFPESPASRAARYGMAWAHLKRGDTGSAQKEFQSLSSGNDTLASGSLSARHHCASERQKRGRTPFIRYAYDKISV
jgi:TolA-binding protein